MHVMMFRATAKPEHTGDLEAAVKTMFAAINKQQPKGVKYASARLADSTTYIILLALDNPADNPLSAIPEFGAFQAGIRGWLAEPTVPEPLTVIGSYNLF